MPSCHAFSREQAWREAAGCGNPVRSGKTSGLMASSASPPSSRNKSALRDYVLWEAPCGLAKTVIALPASLSLNSFAANCCGGSANVFCGAITITMFIASQTFRCILIFGGEQCRFGLLKSRLRICLPDKTRLIFRYLFSLAEWQNWTWHTAVFHECTVIPSVAGATGVNEYGSDQ